MSRLSELLKDLLTRRGLTQADVVRKTEEFGMTVSKGTVSTYFSNPPQRPRRQVLEAFAKVFDVPVSELEEAATFTGREPFAPDPSSDRLTAPQRTAVNEIIRQLAEANEKAGEGNADSPTPMNQAGGKPATGEDDGLGAFGGRARGDLDHEDLNDGNGDNVYSLVPPPPTSKTAAYRAPNRGKKQKDEANKRGEEDQDADSDDGSQDPGDRE